MKFSILPVGIMVALAGGPALAAGPTPAVAEPPVVFAPPQVFTPNWTGAYVGGQIGWASVDTDLSGVDDDDVIGGLIAGYDFDLGNWVVGVGLDYDFAGIDLGPAGDLDSIWRARLRGGYKIGQGLAYATAGFARADTDQLGSDDGYFVGAGYEYLINSRFSLGGEVLYHDFDNFNGSGIEVDATTVQLRGTFRF